MFEKEKTNVACIPCRTRICIFVLDKLILYHLEDQNFLPFSKHTDYYEVFLVLKLLSLFRYFVSHTFFLITKKQQRKIWFHVLKIYAKIALSTLNLFIFSDIKERSCGWAMNMGDEYQNFYIFIHLLIAGDEGCTANLW